MAPEQLYFSVMRDAEFSDAGRVISLASRYISKRLRDRDYGKGVAWVVLFVSLPSEGHKAWVGKDHVFEPGIKTVNTEGFEYDVRDALKIFLSPKTSAVRAANSVGDILESVKMALAREEPALLAINVPDFDMRRFLSDVIAELEVIIESPALWHRFSNRGRFAAPPTTGEGEQQRPVRDFPAAALAFVERELPAVYAAAKRKDRKALMPLINRTNEFVEPWANVMKGPKGAIFDLFPDCAHLVVDLGREIAIECDPDLTEAERQRLHLEFQRRLAGCRECAARLEEPLQ
jgi:hypothetical protein